MDKYTDPREVASTAMSSFSSVNGTQIAPVYMKAFGNFLKLYLQDSNKYIGILNSPGLCGLTKDFTIQLKATLTSSKSQPTKDTSNQKATPSMECPIRIVVYGKDEERSAVGNFLSNADLYLQHPCGTECVRSIKYSNPHYLLRPGSDMPELRSLSLTASIHGSVQSKELDEVNTAHLLRIFDSAEVDEMKSSKTQEPSPCLRSTLMG